MLRWFKSSSGGSGSTLPRPSGPFSVGFVDYEWAPRRNERTDNPPSYILTRIYYPSLPVTKHENSDAMEPEWRGRSHWIPSPSYYPGIQDEMEAFNFEVMDITSRCLGTYRRHYSGLLPATFPSGP